MATSHIVLAGHVPINDYSFLVFASGKGKRRHYWWHCGDCWEECEPTKDADIINDEYREHLLICLGQPMMPATLSITAQRPAPSPVVSGAA